MWSDGYRSRFGCNPVRDERHCPIWPCPYTFPAELEPYARDAHRDAHSEQEWLTLLGELRKSRGAAEAAHREWVVGWERDMAEMHLWLPAGEELEITWQRVAHEYDDEGGS